jgi:hypothetical protein
MRWTHLEVVKVSPIPGFPHYSLLYERPPPLGLSAGSGTWTEVDVYESFGGALFSQGHENWGAEDFQIHTYTAFKARLNSQG